MTGYIVHYYISNKKDNPYKLWIAAHSPEQAESLCMIQAGHRHGYGFKITIIDVCTEDGTKLKQNAEPEVSIPELSRKDIYLNIAVANKAISDSLKYLGKKHKKSFFEKLL